MRKYISLIFFEACLLTAFAQIPVGSFRAHVPMHSFYSVAVDPTTIYAATTNGLMLLDKKTMDDSDPDLSSWTKVDGLSDIDIAKIYYESQHNALIICYVNGNIDIIRNDQLTNVRDVKDKSINSSKRVQNCRFYDGIAYLVYPFGVVIFDLEEDVVLDTWFTKRENQQLTPTDIARDRERFYISTEEGVFSMSSSSLMLSDFTRWTEEDTREFSFLCAVSEQVVAVRKAPEGVEGARDTLFRRTSDGWVATDKNYVIVQALKQSHDTLMICDWDCVELLDSGLERIYKAVWYDVFLPDARDCILEDADIWVADNVYGLVRSNMTYFSNKFFKLEGPYMDYVEKITSYNGIVAAVHGSRKGSTAFAPSYRFPAVSWFQNQEWQFNSTDFLNFDPSHPTYDLNGIAINPKDESEWGIASWTNGVFRCKNRRPVEHYNASNSLLDSTQYGLTQVSGIQYDKQGNLWMTNSFCPKMLKMVTPEGKWYSYNIITGTGAVDISEVVAENLLIDSRGYKWVNFPRAGINYHLIAFYEGGTYDNPGDDKLARIDMNATAEVNSSTVYCMAEDLDGEIWIGTDKGVKVIYYPSKIFNGGVYPRNILLEQDGYVSVLLEYEEVTAIAVDGANRKWIGTSKAGVFLMSENGQEQLLHFTAEDNPLFSNQIVDINIDQLSGEVYFATAKGLVSYRGTATGGFETYVDLPVFPNPVPHGYAGYVSVSGLKANSLCKITDSSGNLVWQGYSDGGQLSWDCKDHFGRRPATGVYYVMASDETGKEKIVTKFVFVH